MLDLAKRAVLYEAIRSTQNSLFLEWLAETPTFSFPFDSSVIAPERENMHFYASYQWELLRRLNRKSEGSSPRKFLFSATLFSEPLDFTSTGSFCIELDAHGHVAQDFAKPGRFNYAQLTIQRFGSNRWVFVVSGLADQRPSALVQLLRSIQEQPKEKLADLALRLAVVHSENTYFRPSWIEALSLSQREEIIARFDYGTDFLVGQRKRPDTLSRPFCFSISARTEKRLCNFK